MLTIYHITDGVPSELCTIPITEDAVLHYDLGGEHFVSLPFCCATPIYFSIGDYVLLEEFGKFELTEPTSPEFDGVEYKYTLKMDASYRKWRNRLMRYIPENTASECSFSLTATIGIHAQVVVRNINACGFRFNGEEYTYDVATYNQTHLGTNTYKLDEAKLVTYQNTNILDGITAIANTFECEWWVVDNIIFFGTCENVTESEEDAPVFSLGVNVETMSRSNSSAVHATRLYAFGSSKNLPDNYRKGSVIDLVTDGIVNKRLMLPTNDNLNGYVQDSEVSDDEVIESVVVFEDIYPKVECEVDRVFYYTHTANNDDGTHTTERFYRVTDRGAAQFLNNFTEAMQLDGTTLHILFQGGALNGMDFECNFEVYHEGGVNYKCVQIIANGDYGIKLPQSPSADGMEPVLIPKQGDKFVLYNWDATKIADTPIIAHAEAELLEKAQEQLRKTKIDASTYTCTMFANPQQWKYQVGQQVRLVNKAYFRDGRMSRVIGYEFKLDIPYDHPQYTIGEKPAMSRLGAIESKLESVQVNGNTYYGGSGVGGGGTAVYLIKEYDSTPANDNNAYSARRSNRRFVGKEQNDSTSHHLSMGGATIDAIAEGYDWLVDGIIELTPDIVISATELLTEGGDVITTENEGIEVMK